MQNEKTIILTIIDRDLPPYCLFVDFCRRQAYRLHADIAKSLGDIYGGISSTSGRIWTKLGRWMANEERVIL